MKSFLKGRHGKFMGPLQLHPVDREVLLYPGGTIHLQDLHFLLRKVRTREIKRGVPTLLDFMSWITAFEAELIGIGGHIVRNNPKLVKEVKKNKLLKKKINYKMEASVLSFFVLEYEVKILEQIYLWCVDNNYIKENVCVLCADGIMLQNEFNYEGCEFSR